MPRREEGDGSDTAIATPVLIRLPLRKIPGIHFADVRITSFHLTWEGNTCSPWLDYLLCASIPWDTLCLSGWCEHHGVFRKATNTPGVGDNTHRVWKFTKGFVCVPGIWGDYARLRRTRYNIRTIDGRRGSSHVKKRLLESGVRLAPRGLGCESKDSESTASGHLIPPGSLGGGRIKWARWGGHHGRAVRLKVRNPTFEPNSVAKRVLCPRGWDSGAAEGRKLGTGGLWRVFLEGGRLNQGRRVHWLMSDGSGDSATGNTAANVLRGGRVMNWVEEIRPEKKVGLGCGLFSNKSGKSVWLGVQAEWIRTGRWVFGGSFGVDKIKLGRYWDSQSQTVGSELEIHRTDSTLWRKWNRGSIEGLGMMEESQLGLADAYKGGRLQMREPSAVRCNIAVANIVCFPRLGLYPHSLGVVQRLGPLYGRLCIPLMEDADPAASGS
ncbi:hypothetical protein FB45DRAFT_863924 [Roridomyces roridus]|uniref:Uncharacterized protein n=1 Tax=Roridomyces roridus TaxID=1738132 RepID=A0AAD7C512_9AGAR|nr:hypothetical protein FB45DRAFT_863924 [Roridomyces roridus]